MKRDIEALINLFVEKQLFLYDYCKFEHLASKNHNPSLTVKIGKECNALVGNIVSTKEGIEKFSKLLDHPDLLVRAFAARFLFPIHQEKCLKILEDFQTITYDKTANACLIKDLKNKSENLTSFYQKLYKHLPLEE